MALLPKKKKTDNHLLKTDVRLLRFFIFDDDKKGESFPLDLISGKLLVSSRLGF